MFWIPLLALFQVLGAMKLREGATAHHEQERVMEEKHVQLQDKKPPLPPAPAAADRNGGLHVRLEFVDRLPSFRRSWNGRLGLELMKQQGAVSPTRSSWHGSQESGLRELIAEHDKISPPKGAAEASIAAKEVAVEETAVLEPEISVDDGTLTEPLLQRADGDDRQPVFEDPCAGPAERAEGAPVLTQTLLQIGELAGLEQQGRGTSYADEEREEAIRHALKVSYFSGGISGAGVISIIAAYFENQLGHGHSVDVKICMFPMLLAFVSATCIMLVTVPCYNIRVPMWLVRSLEFTTLGSLVLAMFDASVLLLKVSILFALVPILVIMIVLASVIAWQNGPSWSNYRAIGNNRGGSSFELASMV